MAIDKETPPLIRTIGILAILVAAAWAFQVLGLGGSDAFGKLLWVVGAAAVAGAGVGLLYTSSLLPEAAGASRCASREA